MASWLMERIRVGERLELECSTEITVNEYYRSQPVEVEALAGKQCRLAVCGKDHMACTVIHGWVPDEEAVACMACKRNFTAIRRRVRCWF